MINKTLHRKDDAKHEPHKKKWGVYVFRKGEAVPTPLVRRVVLHLSNTNTFF